MSKLSLSRRQAIKILGAGGIAIYLSPLQAIGEQKSAIDISKISPIDRSLVNLAERKFFGDDPTRAHKVLWDKKNFLSQKKLESPSENAPLVIIGGGISGLTSAYLLRSHKPIVLEYSDRFGGNSKGQSWRGIDYSIGAAYFMEPEPNSDISKLVKELGVDKIWNIKSEVGHCELKGEIYNDFWSGQTTDEKSREQFQKLKEYFLKVFEGQDIPYPDIPITDLSQRVYIEELDNISFKDHLEKIVGGKLHPHIETAIEHYCWSSFGASMSEISSASGLNFYAAEFGNVAVLPGGNSAFSEKLLEKLLAELSPNNLRPSSLVVDVKMVKDGVSVTYLDHGDKLRNIIAKAVVMACPKFVVNKLIDDLEPARRAAINKLKYRSYLVANVLIKGGIPESFYDYYLLGDGKIESDVKENAIKQMVTDVILANYSTTNKKDTVLTLYRGFPFDGANRELYSPTSYEKYRESFELQIRESILPLLQLKKENIVDLRIARWGHPLPVASTGLIVDGTTELIRKPFNNRIFFVEQDNWALPAFETSITEAFTWAPEVEAALKQE